MNMFISTWVLLVAGLVFAFPMIHMRVKEHTDLADEILWANQSPFACLWDSRSISSMRMDDSGHIVDADQLVREQHESTREKW